MPKGGDVSANEYYLTQADMGAAPWPGAPQNKCSQRRRIEKSLDDPWHPKEAEPT